MTNWNNCLVILVFIFVKLSSIELLKLFCLEARRLREYDRTLRHVWAGLSCKKPLSTKVKKNLSNKAKYAKLYKKKAKKLTRQWRRVQGFVLPKPFDFLLSRQSHRLWAPCHWTSLCQKLFKTLKSSGFNSNYPVFFLTLKIFTNFKTWSVLLWQMTFPTTELIQLLLF